MAEYTDPEKQQMRDAAFGAVFLVSQADPGMFDMIKESFAASKALAKAPTEMQAVFKGMSIPKMPKGDPAQVEGAVLSNLSASVATISAKDPAQLNAYRQTVLDACTSAAEAGGGGVDPNETQVLSKVMSALGIA
ncbi:MAG TPA: hypothetical protein VGJ28_17550 [Micromonosporaceae bacterium]|jgi:hypothetical protein